MKNSKTPIPIDVSSAMAPRRHRLRFPFRKTRLSPNFVGRKLPELVELEELIEVISGHARVDVLARVPVRDQTFPVYGLTLGSTDPKAPVLGLFGGVHGLERIGTHVVLAYLQTIAELLSWDEAFHDKLQKTRLILMPIVNPGGMYLHYRSNPNGVDLMRNAPIDADGNLYPMVSGHRYSPRLPWYRGVAGQPMEVEAQALCDFVRRETKDSVVSICLDVHSGFGALDRLWFPYARTTKPFPNLPEFYAMSQLFDRAYPNHFYRVEPQAKQYSTHGDLWDYLYDEFREQRPQQLMLPLCLEMGSWMWVKKNPRQMFSALGPFNPIEPHRHQRILRRHITLFDFLHRSLYSHHRWLSITPGERARFEEEALSRWYDDAWWA
jgi:hypothetical protein